MAAAAASSSSGCNPLAAAAVAVAVLLATAHAAGAVNHEDECRNSSFPDLCLTMVTSGTYQADYDLALGMFVQARDHIIAGMDNIDRAKSTGGDRSRLSYLEGCKNDYAVALKEMEACIDRFTNAMEPFIRDTYVYNLGNTTKHVYHCILSHKKYENQFPVDQFSVDLSRRIFNTYDLGTRNMYRDASMGTGSWI